MILLLDNKEQLIEVINDKDVFRNDEMLRLTDENYVSYMLSAETKYLPKSIMDKVAYVMVGKDTDYQAYFISKIQTQNNRTTITGVSALIEQLRKTIVPKISGTMTLSQALLIATEDTDIIVNMDTETIHREIFIDIHYEDAWETIKELSHYYGFEIDFNVKYTSADEQSDPYEKRMIIRDPEGIDQPGEAIVYGYNAKSFSNEKDRTETVTALYGFGMPITETQRYKEWRRSTQERLRELHGRHWESFMPDLGFDEDNPPNVDISNVFNSDKPLGQLYYGVPEDSSEMRMLGIWDRETQTYKHKFAKVEFNELEDPIDIYAATKNELQKLIRENIQYKVVTDGLEVNIGDVVRIGSTYDLDDDTDYDKARVIELTRDNKLNKNKDIRIGEHIIPSRNRQRRESSDEQPLTSNPALSSYGSPGDRGSLSGIDDILDGSWMDWGDLDGFGDWEGDFGNNGLDFNTSKKGLNDPDGDNDSDESDPKDEWTEDQEDYPGVLQENLVVVPNILSETAISQIGGESVNHDKIKNWDTLFTIQGGLAVSGPAVPIANYSGMVTEEMTYYLIDGTVQDTATVYYIVGYPNERIGDVVSETHLNNLGFDTSGMDFNLTIAQIYDENYAVPDPDSSKKVTGVTNGLNVLGENFVIVPNDNVLSIGGAASIAARSINYDIHTDEPNMVTAGFIRADVRDIVTGISGDEVRVRYFRFDLLHRTDGKIGQTTVVVIYGPLTGIARNATKYMTRPGMDGYPYDTYFDARLIPNFMTIGDIYTRLSDTYL